MRYLLATVLSPAAMAAAMPLALLAAILAVPLLALVAAPVAAQDDGGAGTMLPTPPPPSGPYAGETVEPEVTITETETEVIYEYRVRGRVYMVKIDPIVGPPYYLLDTDGDGQLDVQEDRPPELAVPQWLLFSW